MLFTRTGRTAKLIDDRHRQYFEKHPDGVNSPEEAARIVNERKKTGELRPTVIISLARKA